MINSVSILISISPLKALSTSAVFYNHHSAPVSSAHFLRWPSQACEGVGGKRGGEAAQSGVFMVVRKGCECLDQLRLMWLASTCSLRPSGAHQPAARHPPHIPALFPPSSPPPVSEPAGAKCVPAATPPGKWEHTFILTGSLKRRPCHLLGAQVFQV